MKILLTILLMLALVAPGTVLAGPSDGALSLWQSVVEWIADVFRALPDYEEAVEPAGTSSSDHQSLPGMGGVVDPAGLAAADGGSPGSPGTLTESEDPPILEMGGNVDPVG